MRLSNIEKYALFKALEEIQSDVYLFGSRTDDRKKGGDIDILIFSERNPFNLSQTVTRKFFLECEEKIDVIVINPKRISEEQQAFLNIIEKLKIK